MLLVSLLNKESQHFPFPHSFSQTCFDIEQLPMSAFALDPYCTQGSGGVTGEAAELLNRHEAEGPQGWHQDQTHKDPFSLRKPSLGGLGAAGPQMSRDTVERMVLVYMAVCTHMFDREHMLSAYNNVCISDSVLHMYTHTHRAMGEKHLACINLRVRYRKLFH